MQKKDVVKAIVKAKAATVKPATIVPIKTPNPPKAKNDTEENAFIWAEGQQESGGDYHAVNANSGALGRWQVMPANLPSWLARSGLPDMSAQAYLDSESAQNKVALTILGGDYKTYGPRGAASVWYSGQPDWKETYGVPPVYQYVDDVIALMVKYPGGGFVVGAGGKAPAGKGVTVISGKVPAPGKDDWSGSIKTATVHLSDLANSVQNHTATLKALSIKK